MRATNRGGPAARADGELPPERGGFRMSGQAKQQVKRVPTDE
ncbi:hypothetical protein [Streptomyces sp. V4I2]|nr:hypothetical protein [Streptomyces sp. V4I2]MDQ1042013.1 hypothetical protein [Streptomyces sp. V4I2]